MGSRIARWVKADSRRKTAILLFVLAVVVVNLLVVALGWSTDITWAATLLLAGSALTCLTMECAEVDKEPGE